MSHRFEPAEGAGGLQVGTPHILSMAPLVGALEVVAEAGIEAIRRKSLALTGYLRALVESELAGHGFGFATPAEDHRRGGHLALVHPEAAADLPGPDRRRGRSPTTGRPTSSGWPRWRSTPGSRTAGRPSPGSARSWSVGLTRIIPTERGLIT